MSDLSVLDDVGGKPIDWWFIYKLPEEVGATPDDGFRYLYYDPNSGGKLSPSGGSLMKGCALASTLKSVFTGGSGVGYVLYNDERATAGGKNCGSKGHVKGVLAFEKATDRAVLLVHSTPRFPAVAKIELPEMECKYGQTYLCIQLRDYATANRLAAQLRRVQEPQVYAARFSDDIKADEEVRLLGEGVEPEAPGASGVVDFSSLGGKAFKCIAKDRNWKKDFWIDLVAPELGANLLVESWVRGKMPPENEGKIDIEDVLELDFTHLGMPGVRWKETKDHAKWAVSVNDVKRWVCVGDLNRMVSQEKRGGGTIAFLEPGLWEGLYSAHVHLASDPRVKEVG